MFKQKIKLSLNSWKRARERERERGKESVWRHFVEWISWADDIGQKLTQLGKINYRIKKKNSEENETRLTELP